MTNWKNVIKLAAWSLSEIAFWTIYFWGLINIFVWAVQLL